MSHGSRARYNLPSSDFRRRTRADTLATIQSLEREARLRGVLVQAMEDRIDSLEADLEIRDSPKPVSGLLDPLDDGGDCVCTVDEESAKVVADLAEAEERLTRENAALVATEEQLRAELKEKNEDIATLSGRLGRCNAFIAEMLKREKSARQRRFDDFLTEMHGSRSDIESISAILSSIWGEEDPSDSA